MPACPRRFATVSARPRPSPVPRWGVPFEYDPAKSKANRAKHGVDFDAAQSLWAGVTVEFPARTSDEPRSLVVGLMEGRHWTAIIARRGGNLRIISVRRSRPNEIAAYEKSIR